MLDRHDGGFVELFKKLYRAVGVVDVVVGQLFAVKLFGVYQRVLHGQRFAVNRRFLMRIFAVTHLLFFLVGERDLVGELDAQFSLEIARDERVVHRGMAVNLVHEVFARVKRHASVLHFREHPFIVAGVGDYRHVLIILRRRTQPGGSADVDVLHRFGKVRAAHNRLLERVKIDYHHVNRVYSEPA